MTDENLSNIRHERSKKDFPALKLDEGEYVEYVFSRARICYAAIWGIVAAALAAIITVYLICSNHAVSGGLENGFLSLLCISLGTIALIGGAVATKIYNCNKLFLTNKRAIQYVMISPMVSSKNAIDLSGIEDVSFSQNSILQKIFKIGTLRLSTVGDETTYTFAYTENPGEDMNDIMKLIRTSKQNLQQKADNVVIGEVVANPESQN